MSGRMDARVESKLCTDSTLVDGLLLTVERSVQQVTDRLDKLILQIKDIQKPYMHGMKPADIVLVRFSVLRLQMQSRPNNENCRSHMALSFAVL